MDKAELKKEKKHKKKKHVKSDSDNEVSKEDETPVKEKKHKKKKHRKDDYDSDGPNEVLMECANIQ